MLSVFVIIMVSWMLFLLSTFDKPPEYLVDRLLYITLGTPNTNTFLPSYYYEDLDVLPYIYSNHVKTLEDFYKWKSGPVLEEYRKRPTLHQVYHDNITRIFNEERDGYTLSKYTMPTSYPDDVIFYRLTPYSNLTDGGSAVLVIPGSGNQGALDVLGEPSSLSLYYYQSEIAKRLVLEGYVVYTIELHGYGEREFDVGQACDNVPDNERRLICSADQMMNRLAMYDISLYDIQTDEITQVLAHIIHNDGMEKVAVVGLSLGGVHAISQAVINSDAITAVVTASGLASHANSPISRDLAGNGQFVCCDTTDAAATISPKPMYVSFGREEVGTFGWEASTNHTGDFLRGVYALHNAEENFHYHVHEGSHGYHVESVIDFLELHLSGP